MPLTDARIRATKPADRIVKLSDGGGLQLWVTPDGAKRWRLAYRFGGAHKSLAIGVYPATGLREARDARQEAKRLLTDGQDPSHAKRLAKATQAAANANTFEAIAAELLEKKKREAKAERTLVKLEWFMSLARPAIGGRPIVEITALELLAVLRPIEARGRLETVKKLRGAIGQVFRFAIATGRAENDPTGALRGALAAPTVNHRAAIIEPKAFGGLLRALAGYDGAPETRAALELLALTFVRPGELRRAEWAEFDLDAGVWTIPAEKMNMKRPHRVPLAPRALAILRELLGLTGAAKFL
ncbi:MAG: integrase arm-type DNA-binding domain-containing protein, partial [Methylocystis sp.]